MKFLSIIISILVMNQSVIGSCIDHIIGYEHHHEELTIQHEDHDHHQDPDDHCASTCACSCCSVVTAYFIDKSIEYNNNTAYTTTLYSSFDSSYRFDFLNAIWQPPRIMS